VRCWDLRQSGDTLVEDLTTASRRGRKRLASLIGSLLSPCDQGSSSVANAAVHIRKNSQIPSDLVVDNWASSVESRLTLDFLYIHYA
jgi:hypothetical protein